MKKILITLAAVTLFFAPLAHAGESKATLKIKGMTCIGCAKQVQTALTKVKGVKTATVNFKENQAVVTIDPKKLKEGKLLAAVKKAGFKAEKLDQFKCGSCSKIYDKPGTCCKLPTKKV